MGEEREACLLEAESSDAPCQPVRMLRIRIIDTTDSNPCDLYVKSQLDIQQYKAALALIDSLLTELKRLDDKMILTEVHLLESRVYRGIGNFPKAKVSYFSCVCSDVQT